MLLLCHSYAIIDLWNTQMCVLQLKPNCLCFSHFILLDLVRSWILAKINIFIVISTSKSTYLTFLGIFSIIQRRMFPCEFVTYKFAKSWQRWSNDLAEGSTYHCQLIIANLSIMSHFLTNKNQVVHLYLM